MALPYEQMVRETSITLALYAVLVDGARGVGDARALLLAALGGEVGGARGAAVLVGGARGVARA